MHSSVIMESFGSVQMNHCRRSSLKSKLAIALLGAGWFAGMSSGQGEPASNVLAAVTRWAPDRPPLWLADRADLVSAVVPLLGSPDADVRAKAAGVLGDVPPRTAGVVKALLPQLDDPVETVSCNAMYAIGAQGDAGAAAVVALTKKVASDKPAIRRSAIAALGALGPRAAAAIPALLKVLQGQSGAGQWDSVVALRHIRPSAAKILQIFIDVARRMLREPAGHPPRDAALLELTAAIGDLGADAVRAEELLVDLAGHHNEMIRATAAEALGRIPARSARAVATLIALLDQPLADAGRQLSCGRPGPATEDLVRASAAEALGAIGRPAWRAVPALQRCADRYRYVHVRAMSALSRIAGTRRP